MGPVWEDADGEEIVNETFTQLEKAIHGRTNWGLFHEHEAEAGQIRLRGCRGELFTTADAWNEYLELAEQNEWRPEHPAGCYRADIGLEVSCRDAWNLANALAKVARSLLRNETTSACPDLPFLVSDLLELIAFCRDGCFRICWMRSGCFGVYSWQWMVLAVVHQSRAQHVRETLEFRHNCFGVWLLR